MEVETYYGTFTTGEDMMVVEYQPYGYEPKIHKGKFKYMRQCMGDQYVVMMCDNGHSYETKIGNGIYITQSPEEMEKYMPSMTEEEMTSRDEEDIMPRYNRI